MFMIPCTVSCSYEGCTNKCNIELDLSVEDVITRRGEEELPIVVEGPRTEEAKDWRIRLGLWAYCPEHK